MNSGTAASDKMLDLLETLLGGNQNGSLRAAAETLGLPSSTAHRMAAALVRRGFIAPAQRGHYVSGMRLANLVARSNPQDTLEAVSRPTLRALASESGATTHLGIWDGEMVTYLVKQAGRGATLFTSEGGQLEAYCSAIGKVLLAHIDPAKRDAYLLAGPFIALTDRTKIDPADIQAELDEVARLGFALDQQEIAQDLFCIALPVRDANGAVIAAVSLSVTGAAAKWVEPPAALRRCVATIERRLGTGGTD
ncbi:IclR family transcriptional regulator [Sphingomonas echinoides]|uniref:IclR family transcriptional regulator n=1 Tax=Sphingomonas echinoides TaxID=59803 RepID=UPI002413801B|nr:IclR family transcriptional regulator [Sphingomonas echinoides]